MQLCKEPKLLAASAAYAKDPSKIGDFERLRPPNYEEIEAERKLLREKLGYEPTDDQVLVSFKARNAARGEDDKTGLPQYLWLGR